jgi:hypothetical protein
VRWSRDVGGPRTIIQLADHSVVAAGEQVVKDRRDLGVVHQVKKGLVPEPAIGGGDRAVGTHRLDLPRHDRPEVLDVSGAEAVLDDAISRDIEAEPLGGVHGHAVPLPALRRLRDGGGVRDASLSTRRHRATTTSQQQEQQRRLRSGGRRALFACSGRFRPPFCF